MRNIAVLAEIGVKAALCGIGYMPSLTRIPSAPAKDIDVLFIGSVNPRRGQLLKQLQMQGVAVHVVFNLYGEERDALIARAKIVLNVHFYPAKLFEIVRVSYLLANKVCVVSETGQDGEVETLFLGGVAFASYNGLVSACLTLLQESHRPRPHRGKGVRANARSVTSGYAKVCPFRNLLVTNVHAAGTVIPERSSFPRCC